MGADAVVGKLNGRTVTLAELDARAIRENLGQYQALYELRRRVLDEIVDDALLADAAAKRGMTTDELIAKEVASNIEEVTDAEVAVFYADQGFALRGQTLESIGPRIEEFLVRQSEATARRTFLDELRDGVDVEVLLPAPRVQVAVAAAEPIRGPVDAPITIVEYGDFECSYCSRVVPTLNEIFETYPDKVRLVFRDFPLPGHANAQIASEAGHCAHAQGKFWQLHDLAFENQRALTADDLKKYAAELSLDMDKFNACLDGREQKARVEALHETGKSLGVTGTPAFFVNGRFVNGAQPFEEFKRVIDEELGTPSS
jgi:protein-disulfide isomerase